MRSYRKANMHLLTFWGVTKITRNCDHCSTLVLKMDTVFCDILELNSTEHKHLGITILQFAASSINFDKIRLYIWKNTFNLAWCKGSGHTSCLSVWITKGKKTCMNTQYNTYPKHSKNWWAIEIALMQRSVAKQISILFTYLRIIIMIRKYFSSSFLH